MMKAFIAALSLLVIVQALDVPNIWPLPQKYSGGTNSLIVDPNSFTFDVPKSSAVLTLAATRYQKLMFPQPVAEYTVNTQVPSDVMTSHDGVVAVLSGVVIKVSNLNESLAFNMNEQYTLDVPTSGPAVITSETVWGALHGLETLSQLISLDFATEKYMITSAPWNIIDFPRFTHRGYLLDTCRHYMPLPAIYDVIDSLSWAKMNVLHWHIVDAQSYPLQSLVRPKMWNGAWSTAERYTLTMVRNVVEYARLRGIRVMLEIDGPGHSWSWGIGYPEVLPANYTLSTSCGNICPHTNTCNVPLDPSKEATYSLIGDLFKELLGNNPGDGYFIDDLMHLGGDEVESGCWAQSDEIKNWMAANGFKTYTEAYKYFVNRVQGLARKAGRTPVHWEEVFLNFGKALAPETIIHVWLDHATLAKVVGAGYRTLLSDWRHWYLDHVELPWQTMYKNEPCDQVSDAACSLYVLGGETCAWSETQDTNNLLLRMWPRTATVAERLWSNRNAIDALDMNTVVKRRLAYFRCAVLDPRGVNCQPISGVWQVNKPASCYDT